MGRSKSVWTSLKKISSFQNIVNVFKDANYTYLIGFLIIPIELVVNFLVIEYVAYTEIDWKAYMQECAGFLNGTTDYSQLKGDTGPLVYPAGFVYAYSLLYAITGQGENVKLGQYIFAAIYLMHIILVLRIYSKTCKVPPYVILLCLLSSYRIHSIYVLRLFNDPIAVLLLYASLNLFLDSYWTLGSAVFSLAVSVKMNILLFAPSLLLFFIKNLYPLEVLKQLFICGVIQLLLGLPFLYTNPYSYIRASFNLGRVFEHKWTVNYRFLDSSTFTNVYFHVALLILHIILLAIFYPIGSKYFESYSKLKFIQKKLQTEDEKESIKEKKLSAKQKHKMSNANTKANNYRDQQEIKNRSSYEEKYEDVDCNKSKAITSQVNFDKINQLFILPMFLCNFIGIACARSLHYQFYSWYFHSLPYIIWCTPYSNVIRFLLLALIELCWNTYPSTWFSSILLHVCHISILLGIYISTRQISSKKN